MPQMANHTRANPIWYTGICDDLYKKIAIWKSAYWVGEVHSTRSWLDPKSGQPVDKPTRMAHRVPFREIELDHLLRITEQLKPNSPLLEELREIRKMWKYAKPIQGFRYMHSYWSKVPLPAGLHRSITLAFYPEHVNEIFDMLVEAKSGQKAQTADAAISSKRSEGKDIFEQ